MISICIPCFNQHDMTYDCITAIRENTQDCEIILIDNGSTPPIKAPFTGDIETRVIRNEENKGFPIAANQGIKAAKGDVIVLFNNDIICTPRWAERLVGWLDKFDIIAPMSNLVGGLQQTVIGPYQSRDELDEAAEEFSEENEGLCQEVNFAVVSMFIKKSIFDDIGYLDETLWPCCGEDIDFCFRAREVGYRIGIAQDVYVHHEMSQTFKAMQDAGLTDYSKVVDQNNKHLAKKWGDDFWYKQSIVDDSIRLNLGCGHYPMQGFVNVDQFANVNPDLVCNALDLPYAPGFVAEIYCGHLLEHLGPDEARHALKYWHDLLRPGGKIAVTVPDFDVLAKKHLVNPTADSMRELNDLYIYSYVQESPHRYCYNQALLSEVMVDAGFVKLERLPVNHPYFVDPVDWQIGFSGVKP